ncbi:L-threonine 3-dehydrogenase [Klebsiella michiganensis]|nr:L-threonine 3-dehydrogenase [Klebsiella michiganensis]
MKALSKLKAEEGIWMTDVPEPEVGHNDLLIKIRKTAICGTDVHIYNWDEWSQKTIPVPMVVGHEYVGEVVGIGQEVRGFKLGDRVSGEGHITCGHCRNCRAGAYASVPQYDGRRRQPSGLFCRISGDPGV